MKLKAHQYSTIICQLDRDIEQLKNDKKELLEMCEIITVFLRSINSADMDRFETRDVIKNSTSDVISKLEKLLERCK